ncbi:hypothetical protein PHLCEN_2v12 [Hermanssonia centrifuga]|uniref:CCR4-NOT transcription complex subunit 11 n=1 Tax=Hermanssonia centrifuga TaxID=98765 RepID=A0A2R6S7C8_9APHY|nr:hypothetical protein PHLCEN_2v12 [Hermanssonia centrifuga]
MIAPDSLADIPPSPWLCEDVILFLRSAPAHNTQAVVEFIIDILRPLARRDTSLQDRDAVVAANSRYPASPYLWFTVYLACDNKTASSLLLASGLLHILECLYDTEFSDRPPHGGRIKNLLWQNKHDIRRICYLVLSAISKHIDLHDFLLLEQLTYDIRMESRRLSELLND